MTRLADSHLSFERSGESTVVSRALAIAPLRLLTPRNHGAGAWAYTTTLGGGLLGGDEIRLRVSAGRDARALLSSQGATRVYRSAHASTVSLEIVLEEGALLAVLPDPTACFAGSRVEQRTSVRMAAGSSLALAECVTAGRGARDGRWALSRYRSALRVEDGRAPRVEGADAAVIDEALLLDALHGPLAERLGRFDCFATVILRGPLLEASAAAALSRIGAAPVARDAAIVEAASPIAGGAVVRIAAVSVEAATARVREILSALPALFGDDPFVRRG